MKKEFAIFFLFILASGFVSTLNLSNEFNEEVTLFNLSNVEINKKSCASFESSKDNLIGLNLPRMIPFRNEIFNIYVGEEIFGNVQIENRVLKNFSCIKNENNTYSIYIKDYSTIKSILESVNPLNELKTKLNLNEIQVKGETFVNEIRWFFIRIGLNFISQ